MHLPHLVSLTEAMYRSSFHRFYIHTSNPPTLCISVTFKCEVSTGREDATNLRSFHVPSPVPGNSSLLGCRDMPVDSHPQGLALVDLQTPGLSKANLQLLMEASHLNRHINQSKKIRPRSQAVTTYSIGFVYDLGKSSSSLSSAI